ncbi:Fur family transcriptional regulator [Sandarakinorhabdus rubra]|uniref:Fur family transcriptional regulator n=1 Tax=Sandarakinorhabdus rubra TaxID=2672568 RepID=UPI0013DCD50A|nr:transcriptional repressor [Sandarakinorhabdus rubra]
MPHTQIQPHRHDQHHKRADLASAAEARLTDAGEQWTPLRASVFAALAGFDRPVSAYEVTDAVSSGVGRRIAANSVYRILDLFVANNIASRVESANAFIANAHPDCPHDCIFLVCDRCGSATHVDDDRITGDVRAAARAAGFQPLRPVVEVRGLCAACA